MIIESVIQFGEVFFDVMLAASLKAAVLIPAVWIILRAVHTLRPAVEHGIWAATMIVMLALPMLGVVALVPEVTPLVTIETGIPVVASVSPETTAIASRSIASSLAVAWRVIAGLLVFSVALMLVIPLIVARRRLAALVATGEIIQSPALDHELKRALATVGLEFAPHVAMNPELSTPVAFEGKRPTIILPSGWSDWPTEKLRVVLLHELAHIARRDGLLQSSAAVNAALFWFHPIAYVVRQRLKLLAEQACDDHAISVVDDKEGYAETLLDLARANTTSAPLAVTAMAQGRSVSGRIERILAKSTFDSGLLSRSTRRKLVIAGVACALSASIVSITFGQATGVALSGTVNDPSGARVPGASILISAPAEGIYEGTVSVADGSFSIAGLQPSSTYQLEVSARGFMRHRQAVDLSSDQKIDITLKVGQIQEEIVVSGRRPDRDPLQAQAPKRRIRVGGDVQKAKLLYQVRPIYPNDAERDGVEGTVLMEAIISKEGEPIGLRTVNSVVDGRLATAALDAIRQWRYKPTLLNGEPVEIITSVKVTFQLP